MRTKHKITEEPWFFERVTTAHSSECPMCNEHRYVILQNMGSAYVMHSYIAKSSHIKFLHRWTMRGEDPACLLDFVPVKPVPGWSPKLNPIQWKDDLDKVWPNKDFASFVDQLIAEQNTTYSTGGALPPLNTDPEPDWEQHFTYETDDLDEDEEN